MTKEKVSIKKNTPTVLQMEAVECGAASLGMILGYYKKFVPLESLRIECGVSRDGSKASNVIKAARKHGLEAKGLQKEPEELAELLFPMIVFWNFNHFVVLEGMRGDKVYINDPGEGKRTLSWDEFDQSFTGVVLTFQPGPDFQPGGTRGKVIPMIRKRLEGSESILSFAVIAGLFLIVPGIIIPTFSRFFVDKILVAGMTGFLKPLLLAMGGIVLLKGALTWLQEYYLLRFETKLALSSSSKFLNHIFKIPLEFFSQRMPGEITNRIQANDSVSSLISGKMANTAISLFSVFFFAILMFQYDVVLTLVCIFTSMLNFLTLKLVSEKRKITSQKLKQEYGKLFGVSMNGISMIETLKATGSENDFFSQWSGQQARVVRELQKMTMVSQTTSVIPYVLQKVLDILILMIGGLRVMSGDITMGMLVAFQALMGSFTDPVKSLMGMGGEFQSAIADFKRLDDVSNYPISSMDRISKNEIVSENIKLNGFVELKNVTFGYSRLEEPLLKNFNLRLTPGARIALVGGSGSGKSTIAKLICGLYDPWEGEILFDGIPLQKLGKKVFTSSLSMVDQDIFLFAGTIKDNLTMWDTTIKENDFIKASKDACIHDIIASRPGGYYSLVEEGGANLSGGQRQRIEIARALTTDPRILVLDEATSALDPVTENLVDENIRRRGCSCIIVAHRLSTIRDCDEIIVLHRGEVVQRGSHAELLEQEGHYRDLIKTY
jgi:NHLM bacteriocin system ABC transporter peptidase/ATP-binding protein